MNMTFCSFLYLKGSAHSYRKVLSFILTSMSEKSFVYPNLEYRAPTAIIVMRYFTYTAVDLIFICCSVSKAVSYYYNDGGFCSKPH